VKDIPFTYQNDVQYFFCECSVFVLSKIMFKYLFWNANWLNRNRFSVLLVTITVCVTVVEPNAT
jgi:hypothetical protein